MLKNLVSVLKNMSSLSISGDVQDIKVLCNVNVVEDAESIIVSGVNEELEQDYFIIAANNIIDVQEDELMDFIDLDIFLGDGNRLCIESF